MGILDNPVVAGFLDRYGDPGADPPPVAVFDCDGTVIKGDIGEAMFYRQVERFQFRRSPADVWTDHPRRAVLARIYADLAALPPAQRRSNPAFDDFAAMLLGWYEDQIASGEVAKACADIVRLFAGYTTGEVRLLARETFEAELASPFGTRPLGGRDVPCGARYIGESVDLIGALAQRRFDIWAVSGSNAWSVEPVFARFGVPPGRVIGIDLRVRDGFLTAEANDPVPIRAGKIDALRSRTDQVPVVAVSDSKNDIPLLLYSSGLRVRINSRGRDTDEFFRSGGIAPDETWVLVESPHILER